MNGHFEGDLIRPLGLVTLYFGYAEAQVNFLIAMLQENGLSIEISPSAPFGRRISDISEVVKKLSFSSAHEVINLLEESKALTEKRNSLVHASVLSKGRVIPNDPKISEYRITAEELTSLADEVFHWKERLNAAIQLRLIPAIRAGACSRT